MKAVLLQIDDSNMADSGWNWTFLLSRTADRRYTISRPQLVDGKLVRWPGRRRLKDGSDIFEALCEMLEEFEYRPADFDLEDVAKNIKKLDATLAVQFLDAYESVKDDLHSSEEEADFYSRQGVLTIMKAAP